MIKVSYLWKSEQSDIKAKDKNPDECKFCRGWMYGGDRRDGGGCSWRYLNAVVLAQFVVQKKLIHSDGRRSRSDKSKVKTTISVDFGNMFLYLLLCFHLQLWTSNIKLIFKHIYLHIPQQKTISKTDQVRIRMLTTAIKQESLLTILIQHIYKLLRAHVTPNKQNCGLIITISFEIWTWMCFPVTECGGGGRAPPPAQHSSVLLA